MVMSSSDELLHVTIYEWMMRKKMTGQLLRVRNCFSYVAMETEMQMQGLKCRFRKDARSRM